MPLIDPYDIKPSVGDMPPPAAPVLIDPYAQQMPMTQAAPTELAPDPQATGMFSGGAAGQAVDQAFSYLPNFGSGQQFLDARKQSQQDDMQARQQEAGQAGANVPSEPTKYGAMVMSEFANQPQAKIVALAKSRFPDMPVEDAIKRYGVMNNHIVFVGEDGHLYAEDKVPLSASLIADAPVIAGQIIGGGLGAVAGGGAGSIPLAIGGAAAGGAIGSGVKDTIAHYALGDDPNYATNAAVNGALGAFNQMTGEVGSRVVMPWLKQAGADVFNKIVSKAKGTPYVNPNSVVDDAGAAFIQDAKNLPAPLNVSKAEATLNKADIEQEKVARQMPGGAEKFGEADQIRNPKIRENVQALLDSIAPAEAVPNASNAVRESARQGIKSAKTAREELASPHYKNANPEQISSTSYEALMQDPVISSTWEKLQRDPAYIKGLRNAAPNSAQALHAIKTNLDAQIDAASSSISASGKDAYRASELLDSKNKLLTILGNEIPEYKAGLDIFKQNSAPVNQLQQGIIGKVAETKDTQLNNVAGMLFDTKQSDPRVLQQAMSVIKKQNPDAWYSIVRSHLQSQFEGMRDAVQNGATFGKAFATKVMGTQKQRDMLAMALQGNPEAYENFKLIARIMPRLGVGGDVGSPTATRATLVDSLKGGAGQSIIGGLIGGAAGGVADGREGALKYSLLGAAGLYGREKITAIILKKNASALADAMLNPQYSSEMATIRKMNPGSQQAAGALTNLLSRIGEDSVGRNFQYMPDQPIPMQTQ